VHRTEPLPGRVRARTGARFAAAGFAVLLGVTGCASTLTTEEYQGLLTGLEQAVQPPIDRLAAATSVDEVTAARSELVAAMRAQMEAFRDAGRPPEEAGVQHGAVLGFLGAAEKLAALAPPDGTTPDECGIVPTPEEQTAQAKADVRAELESAGATLTNDNMARAGLSLAVDLVPPGLEPPAEQNRRGENGAVLDRNGPHGRGTLEINNGGDSDAVVAAVASDPKAPLASVYVRGNSTARITGIAGTYQVYFKSGEDWDEERKAFTRDCSFQKFDDVFSADSAWRITITPVIGGNATSSDVPPF
jgi:hypothetical protein